MRLDNLRPAPAWVTPMLVERVLRATAKYPDWTPAEDQALRAFFARSYAGDQTPQSVLAQQLGRTVAGLRSRADKLGVTQSRAIKGGAITTPVWTDDEVEILRVHYGRVKTPRLLAMLPGRTKAAIYSRANMLGLEHGYIRPWSDDELQALRIAFDRGLAIADLATALHRNPMSVSKYCLNHGLQFGARRLVTIPLTLADVLALEDPSIPLPATVEPRTGRRRTEHRHLARAVSRREKAQAAEQARAKKRAERDAARDAARRVREERRTAILRARELEKEATRRAKDRERDRLAEERRREREMARAEAPPRQARSERAVAAHASKIRRAIVAQAEAFVDSGKALTRATPIHIKLAQRAIVNQRAEAARHADPLEQAKLALQRRGRIVYSMIVHGGRQDRFFVSGLGKDVTPEQLLAAAERLAA